MEDAKSLPWGLVWQEYCGRHERPSDGGWSRMEISPRRFGQSLARSLLAATQSTATGLASYRILAEWCPGSTHFAASPRPVD
jgi:hypothetical protein